jgi:hypothetical protein
MGICRRYLITNELARDSLTTTRTRQPNACQHMHSENLNVTQAAHTIRLDGETRSDRIAEIVRALGARP